MAETTKNMGYLNSFVAYARQDLKKEKPAAYSKSKVYEILDSYETNNADVLDEGLPNIIVLMNEAFSDSPAVYEFATNEDGMPNIHSLKENTVKGHIMVSVFGGGTANTEFEFISIDDDLEYTETLRGYMSDSADVDNVIDIYENKIKQEWYMY